MTSTDFFAAYSPKSLLARVNIDGILEKQKNYFSLDDIRRGHATCFFCGLISQEMIFLSDRTPLCVCCLNNISTIQYPEKYEFQRREYLARTKLRDENIELLNKKIEKIKQEPYSGPFFGCIFFLLSFLFPGFLVFVVFSIVCSIDFEKNKKVLIKNEQENFSRNFPEEPKPNLFSFLNSAYLSDSDRKILFIFQHWPGYPPFWEELRAKVLERDRHTCQVTGCPNRLPLHIHHVIPISKGGSHIQENLVSLCLFHHGMEPSDSHDRLKQKVETDFFSFVPLHFRKNQVNNGFHEVKSHLRRKKLASIQDIRKIISSWMMACPRCNSHELLVSERDTNKIRVQCSECHFSTSGEKQLPEEMGPRLVKVLKTGQLGKWRKE